MSNDKVYIHEFIDIIGPNRLKYMHHMTANWCPEARKERRQLCFGVWGTVGSTGRWPEVVNLWEIDGWEGLAHDFEHELANRSMQDPVLAEWWQAAAAFRSGGFDRIVVPASWSPTIGELNERGVCGAVYAHEVVSVPPGKSLQYLNAVADHAVELFSEYKATAVGAFRTAMRSDDEAIVIWAFPSFDSAMHFEASIGGISDERLNVWSRTQRDFGAKVQRTLLVDAPLSPLRIGRQPEVADRLPLEQV